MDYFIKYRDYREEDWLEKRRQIKNSKTKIEDDNELMNLSIDFYETSVVYVL